MKNVKRKEGKISASNYGGEDFTEMSPNYQ